jgi:hypothetical protein
LAAKVLVGAVKIRGQARSHQDFLLQASTHTASVTVCITTRERGNEAKNQTQHHPNYNVIANAVKQSSSGWQLPNLKTPKRMPYIACTL